MAASAKQTTSGKWRIQVYSHTDVNGKKHYLSFTESTKEKAELKAAQFANKKKRTQSAGVTVSKAIDNYITAKHDNLAPSTRRSYRNLQKKYYKELANKDIEKLTQYEIQMMFNNMKTKDGLSNKSIKNAITLFTASLKFHSKDLLFNIDLPQEEIKEDISVVDGQFTASNEDVALLFKAASPWMQKCIALAAFSGLRRGEIAALKYKDILPERNQIFVHTAFSMNEDNKWELKTPKTENSMRLANIPSEVIELLGEGEPDALIIGYNPNTISKMFNKLKNRMGVDITFHDLRHYYASIGNVLGVPDRTLASFAGWDANSPVIKGVYQEKIKDISDGYAKKMNDYFAENVIKNAK